MPYQWLLFDADGTLFNYEAAEEKALLNSFDAAEIVFLPQYGDVYGEVNAALWRLFEQGEISLADLRITRFAQFFERVGVTTDAAAFSRTYLNFLGQSTDLIPGALEILAALQGHYRMVIITNGISEVQRSRLSLSPIKDYFEDIFISEEIGISKPATGYFDAVFNGIGHPLKEAVLVIGDSLSSDMRGGINYGLDTCWFNPNGIERPAEMNIRFEINKLDQLLEILKR